MSVKVSIIMPVYNGEKYLRQTLECIKMQTFQDYELIAVNDGSWDESLAILQEYTSEIEKIHIISQENAGVSTARNNGLQVATGEFLCFFDADDLYHPSMLEYLLGSFSNPSVDIAFCDITTSYQDICDFEMYEDAKTELYKNKYGDQTFDQMMDMGLGTSICNKMFRRSLLRDNDIIFNPQSGFGEDMFLCWKACIVAREIAYIRQALYIYRLSSGTATTKYHPNLYEKYCQEFDDLLSFAERYTQNMEQLKKSVNLNFAQRVLTFLRMNARKPAAILEKKKYIDFLCNDNRIRQALEERLESTGTLPSILLNLYQKKCVQVLIQSLCDEWIFRLKRRIRNIWKGKRK